MQRSFQIPFILFAFLFLGFTNTSFAQTTEANHQLLWEISGNGLEKPSYLYGTIHLADKRAFEFSDSVLLKLEGVEAFAMEALPNDIMGFLFEEILVFDPLNEKKWKKLIGEEKYAKINKWTVAKVGFSLSDVNTKYPWVLSFFAQSANTSKQKATFLDAHLYQLAKLQSKKLLGIEKMGDYTALYEDVPIEEQIAQLEEVIDMEGGEKAMEEELEKLLKLYRSGDLKGIDGYIQENAEKGTFNKDKLLLERNEKMANRIAEYAQTQPTFVAIGAAHLAGEKSVIDLLKAKGFQLRPVTAVFSGLAEKYEAPKTAKEADWQIFEIPNVAAQIEIPAQPYRVKLSGMPDFFQSYIYPDLGEGLFYSTSAMIFPPSIPHASVSQVFENYADDLVSEGNKELPQQKCVQLRRS